MHCKFSQIINFLSRIIEPLSDDHPFISRGFPLNEEWLPKRGPIHWRIQGGLHQYYNPKMLGRNPKAPFMFCFSGQVSFWPKPKNLKQGRLNRV
jgi:hypothetical protein